MRMRVALLLAVGALSSGAGAQARPQIPGARLIEQARVQLDELAPDSAYVLLQAALQQQTLSSAERVRAFTLLAIAQLNRNNQPAAIQAFGQALRIEQALRIDSLASLHSDAEVVFGQARARQVVDRPVGDAPRLPALALDVRTAADTMLPADNPRLVINVQPNRVATIVAYLTPANDPTRRVWADSQASAMGHVFALPLRTAPTTLLANGDYMLRVQARDSAGQTAPLFERRVRVARVRADTQPLPPPLAASRLLPEQIPGVGSKALLIGGAFALLAVATPMALGEPTLNDGISGDATGYVVAGGVAAASVVGFLTRRQPRVHAENVAKNRDLRQRDQRQRDDILRRNAAAVQSAPVRVTVERAP